METVGVNRKITILLAKVLSYFQHFIYTEFSISQNTYGSEDDDHGGIGQGNLFSGESCKVKSYLIFRNIEEKELGIIVKIPISNSNVQRSAVAFVDDTSFYTAGEDFKIKMQQILDCYTELYEATGELVEYNKSYCYIWKQQHVQGKDKLVDQKIKL